MKVVTVLYPARDDAKFDFECYTRKHIPWVSGLFGSAIEVRRGLPSPEGVPAAFVATATIHINSVDQFQAVMATHGSKIMADIPKYTNIEPIVQFEAVLS